MRISPERVLLDTNVLIYAYNIDAPEHAVCRDTIERGGFGTFSACVCPQVLLEFLVAVTNSKRVTHARSITQAMHLVEELADSLPLVYPPADLHRKVIALYKSGGSFGRTQAYDLALAATVLENNISHIASYDDVFERVHGVTVVRPVSSVF